MINADTSTFFIDHHFLDGLHLPIFIQDLNGKYLYCNGPFSQFLGISIQQIVGLTNLDLQPHSLSAVHAIAHEALLRLDQVQSEQLIALGPLALAKVVFKKAPLCNADHEVIGSIGSIHTNKSLTQDLLMRNDQLTPRENEVLSLLSMGLSVKGIADKLVISPHTVSHHLKEIYAKLGAHSKNEALFKAFSLSAK